MLGLLLGIALVLQYAGGLLPEGPQAIPDAMNRIDPQSVALTLGAADANVTGSFPWQVPAAGPELPTIRLLFTGDINPGRLVAEYALVSQDFTLPYHSLAEELRVADITVGSLDGSLSDLAPPETGSGSVNLIGPSQTASGLAYAGFDILTVATNHALDCGSLGWRCGGRVVEDTLGNLLAVDIRPVGLGRDLAEARRWQLLERYGVRFAFLAFNAVDGELTWASETRSGTAPLSDQTLPEVVDSIRAAASQADVVIVLPHWGEEFSEIPTPEQRAWAAALIAAGADLVIGNHPHVIQPVESLPGGGVVAYSLGNFVFDQLGNMSTRQGLIFEARFSGAQLSSWTLRPVTINLSIQPVLAQGELAEKILSRLEQGLQRLAAP